MDIGPLLRLKTEVESLGRHKVLILQLSGKINSDNIFDLNKRVKIIFEDGNYNCILNLSELEYINSTGIAMLLTIARTIEQNSGKLVLTKPSAFVSELLDMTDLNSRFQFADDLEAARRGFETT